MREKITIDFVVAYFTGTAFDKVQKKVIQTKGKIVYMGPADEERLARKIRRKYGFDSVDIDDIVQDPYYFSVSDLYEIATGEEFDEF